MENKYTFYKNMWWKYVPPAEDGFISGCPIWKISEYEEDSICYVWMFNACVHSLDQAYEKIEQDADYKFYKRRQSQILYNICMVRIANMIKEQYVNF